RGSGPDRCLPVNPAGTGDAHPAGSGPGTHDLAAAAPGQYRLWELLMAAIEELESSVSAPRVHCWRLAALWRRTLLLMLVIGQTGLATWFMLSVLPYRGFNALVMGVLVLFAHL